LNKIFNFFKKVTGIFQYLRNVVECKIDDIKKIYIYKMRFSQIYIKQFNYSYKPVLNLSAISAKYDL